MKKFSIIFVILLLVTAVTQTTRAQGIELEGCVEFGFRWNFPEINPPDNDDRREIERPDLDPPPIPGLDIDDRDRDFDFPDWPVGGGGGWDDGWCEGGRGPYNPDPDDGWGGNDDGFYDDGGDEPGGPCDDYRDDQQGGSGGDGDNNNPPEPEVCIGEVCHICDKFESVWQGVGCEMCSCSENQQQLNQLVRELQARMRATYPNMTPFPLVIYDPVNVRTSAYGRYFADTETIGVGYRFFRDDTPEYRRFSILVHEYDHFVTHGYFPFLIINDLGEVYSYKTDLPIERSDREMELIREMCDGNSYCVDFFENEDFLYRPSNYFKDEISAIEAELRGERHGWYVLSDEYRQEREDRLDELRARLSQALDFERDYGYHGRNPDGSRR